MKRIYLLLLLISTIQLLSAKDIINFAPLPLEKSIKNIEEFLPMNTFLKEKLQIDIKYIYKKDYADIIKGFADGSIDIAYLGPLPYLYLKKHYKDAVPIVTFRQVNGESNYRCVLAKFKDDIIDKSQTLKIALTQPLSTCGYYITSILLSEKFDINISKQHYNYTMSHSNALIQTLEGKFILAGAKDTIAKQYETLGMEIIAQSHPLPGFSLVVNTKTLTQEQMKDIEKTLLTIPENIYKHWGGITSRGMIQSSLKEYERMKVDFDTIPLKGNMP